MRLVVNKPGLFVGVKSGMIVVREGGKKIAEVAPSQITRVVVTTRGATLSTALLRLLARHRIPLIVLSGTGFPSAKMLPVRGGYKAEEKPIRGTEGGEGATPRQEVRLG